MRFVVRFRWVVLALWVLAVFLLAWKAPGMEGLVRDKGQISVPDGYPSKIADEIKSRHSSKEKNTESFIVVFHSDKKLSSNQLQNIHTTIDRLKDNEDKLSIRDVTNYFDQKDLKKQLVAKDGKTILALLDIKKGNQQVKDIRSRLEKAIKTPNVETMMTGNALINEDVVISSQAGLKKTEIITLVFILAVLILVFRSVVAPLIPLITVGFSYMISQSVVAILVDKFNFPLSNFTQIFLVAVLFGVGTDYCILLLSRYKEELSNGKETIPAIICTYKSAGKTVLFSGIAVLIGFASIGFATFKLYQSASAVAIGIVFLLIALLTIVPFFMATLKKALFWPVRGDISHSQSKLWGRMGNLAIARPLIAVGIVAIITIPLLISYDGKLSYNSLDEVGNKYESVKAFNLVADSFGPGNIMPVEVVLENDVSMKSKDYLGLMEKINNDVASVSHVDKVRSATRPLGEIMKEIYVKKQAGSLSQGIQKGNKGIDKIKNGLNSAAQNLSKSKPKINQATSGIGSLQTGTKSLQSGIMDLQTALTKIEKGIRSGSKGAADLKAGVEQAQKQAAVLQNGTQTLLSHYNEIQNGVGEILKNYQGIPSQLNQAETDLKGLAGQHPEIAADPQFRGTLKDIVIANGTATILNSKLSDLNNGLNQANAALSQITGGLSKFETGFDPIISGLDSLEKGITQAADGQSQVIGKLPDVKNGLGKIVAGQSQLQSGFGSLGGQMDQLSSGLNQSVDGLNQIGSGLDKTGNYLNKLSQTASLKDAGVYIPDELLANKDFQKSFDAYVSNDGKMATFDIVLNQNPYSNQAIETVGKITDAIKRSIKGTKLENVRIGIGGVSSINHDLQTMSKSDYNRTVLLMLIGIFIVLVIMLRSLVMPIYLIASLLLTYYCSISVTEIVFEHILGYSGISWAVPFFGFVILMALGIDYSIFLMDRFTEYRDLNVREGILLAMKNMGTVIISAAIILAGTFAAMLPSGVLSLLEIATIVLTGLLFYALIFLPLLIPVIVKLMGKANWWPFISMKE
jgi:RND superfamily putative drug exporter